MTDKFEDSCEEEKIPERPLECSECKKPIAVRYTEIIGKATTCLSMCNDCPELLARLKGSHIHRLTEGTLEEGNTGLACGNCGTTLDALRVGMPLGCSVCYEVFDDILLSELLASEKIPQRIIPSKKSTPIHLGRAPGQAQEMNPSMRLLALNEALNETLAQEDYEQAAWLRDQIKAITENPEQTQ